MRANQFIAIALLSFQLAHAEETGEVASAANESPAAQTFKTGLALMKEADVYKNTDVRTNTYREALGKFDEVTEQKPDFYPAHMTAAYCLSQLAELTPEPRAHRELIDQASQRYETASKLPAADARLYVSWASLLIGESSRAPNPAQRRELLDRAVQLLTTGMNRADSKAERGRLAYQFGRAELFQAQVAGNRVDRRALYESARAHFQAAAEIDSIAKLPQLYGSWGIVLLELGRLNNDRMLFRQSIERLQTSLEKDPKNFTVRYNLVCGYALLGQTENAMRHLRQCLDNDDAKRTYFTSAQQDPDLDSLRSTAEFNDIFGAAPSRPLDPFEKPAFSDK